MNRRGYAQNFISAVGRRGIVCDSEMHFSMYNEYIHNNPSISDKSSFYNKRYIIFKSINKQAVQDYILQEHGDNT
jgi:hypothetical protein